MKRKRDYFVRVNPRATLIWSLIVLLTLLISGCSIGPVSVGEDANAPTPTPSGPTPTSTVPPPTATPNTHPLAGKVLDIYTGAPIAGADVTAGGVLTETTTDGSFSFDAVPLDAKITAGAKGYASGGADPARSNTVTVKLRPNTLTGTVTDATTGKPISQVLVKLVLPAQPVTPTGTLSGTMPVTATVAVTATQPAQPITPTTPTTTTFGFSRGLAAPIAQANPQGTEQPANAPTELIATDTPSQTLPTNTPLPPTATPTPKPIPPTGDGFIAVYTDDNGTYSFDNVPEGASLTFKMPGYKLTKMPIDGTAKKDVALEEFKVEGAYITANVASSPDILGPLLDFISKSRINAVVLNVQDDASAWAFPVQNADVLAADDTDLLLPDITGTVKMLHDRGLYVIARVVTFQQKTMADAHPEWAVRSSTSGKPWKGGYAAQQRWLDASNPATQDYMIDMTKEVLNLGFDEIQYDYIRFPSDPAPSETGDMVFSAGVLTDTGKVAALQQFFKKAYETIQPTDAFMSADVFGYSLWPDQDGKPILGVIGQVLPALMPYADYLSPMIYPSHFSVGEQGCDKPATCAYKLVKQSGVYAGPMFEGQRAKYRPWLEDFDWPGADYTSPGTTKVSDQRQAAEETNAWGWLWWDASNVYEPRSAFLK